MTILLTCCSQSATSTTSGVDHTTMFNERPVSAIQYSGDGGFASHNVDIVFSRFGHGSAELENSLYVVGGHTAIAGVFPASPSVSLKQVRKTLTFINRMNVHVC